MNITEITSTKKQTAERLRLAPYCRVSSDSTDQLHSFAAQIRYYSDYAKKHPEYQLVDIYADEGITGTEMKKRDELNRLIADCRKGKVDRIIVKSVSRLARNTEELLVLLRMCKEIGVSVYFEEQGIDTEKLNMEMIVTFPGMAAQQESVNISGNLRWSYQKRMQSGNFNCTCPAYGFDLKDGELVINETEAAVIRRIFDLYLQGYGTLAIAKMLNEDGIPRKHGYEKWLPSSINYVLNNERYMGDALLQKSYTTETLPFRKMKNDGRLPQYYVENSNPAIVSRETFQAAQNLLRSRKTERCKRKSYPLTGKLRCPECGRVFRHQVINGKAHWIGSCRSSGATECQHRHVREDIVYGIFTDMVIKLKTYRTVLLGISHCLTNGVQFNTQGYFFIDMNADPQLTETARCITARQDSGISKHKGEHSAVFIEDEPRAVVTPDKKTIRQQGRWIKEPNEPMFTLTVQDRHGILRYGRVRKLTPRECWRLQGFTDKQFDKAAATGLKDGRLYKMAGIVNA